MRVSFSVLFLLIIHFVLFLVVVFDIPIMRQLFAFAYLLFVPGFAFLCLIVNARIRLLEVCLFSVGLSVGLLMFIGLLINNSLFALGYLKPLSTIPVLLVISSFTLVFFYAGRKNLKFIVDSSKLETLRRVPLAASLGLMLLPIFSAFSVLYFNVAIPLIPLAVVALILLASFSSKIIPVRLYPILIFSISLSLSLMTSLMSKHIMGQDSVLEYSVYKFTSTNQHWVPITVGDFPEKAFSSMLSITILPTMFFNVSNLNGELLFKLLFPIIFSIVPLISYRILAKNGWNLGALLSSLFLVSSPVAFFGPNPLSLNRQIIGLFFLILSIFLLSGDFFSKRRSQAVLLIFGASITISHYTISVMFLSFLALLLLFSKLTKKSVKTVNVPILLVLIGINFFWFSVVQTGIVNTIYDSVANLLASFQTDLVSAEARPNVIFSAHPVRTFASSINWILFILVHLLLVVGIFAVTLNKREGRMCSLYRLLVICCATLLILTIVVPNLSATLNFERFYAIALLFLTPCFVIGAKLFIDLVKRSNWLVNYSNRVVARKVNLSMLLISIVLAAYFLSQYGFINYATAASPQSITLDWERLRTSNDPQTAMNFYSSFTPQQDVDGGIWLSKFMLNNSVIYSDFFSKYHPLKVFSNIPEDKLLILTNYTSFVPDSFVYLRYYNVNSGYVIAHPTYVFNTTELSKVFNSDNLVFSNGDNLVYSSNSK